MHNAAASTAPHTPQPTRETPEGVLTHLQENDYRLDGNSCWISVGPHVVYIFQRPDGVVVEVFEEAPGQLTGPVKEAFVRIEPE